MNNHFSSVKRVFLGLAVLAAFSVAPAFAASPVIRDAGSAYWTARVNGSGFTPSGYVTNQAYVLIYNGYDNSYVAQNVNISASTCGPLYCYAGGTFSASIDMAPHQCSSRQANAYDYASHIWTGWISIGCA
jgi:hypothetical protein